MVSALLIPFPNPTRSLIRRGNMRRFLGLLMIIMMITTLSKAATATGNEYDHMVSTDRNSIVIANGRVTIASGEMMETPGAPAVGYRIIKLALRPGTEIARLTVDTSDPEILGSASLDFVRGDLKTGNYPADNAGHVHFNIEPQNDGYLTITAILPRYIPSQITALVGSPAGVDDEPGLPREPTVSENYPNPLNPNTTIEFYLPARASANLEIFDIRGRLVKNLASGKFPAGSNRIIWDGENDSGRAVASGIYFYKFSTGSTVSVKQMTMLK